MTTNQLKYWELRWKQWYEYQLLQHKKAELAEQKRATRVKEKQEYQRIALDREDLDRKWDELNEKKRAAIVGEALRKYEADIQLMNVQSMAQQRLEQMKTVAADLYLQYTKAEDESQRKWYEAYAEAANKGWGQGAFYAAYEMADRSNLVSQGKEDMLGVFNSIPGFKVPVTNKANINGSSENKISVTTPVKNNGILAVTKSNPNDTKLSAVGKTVGKVASSFYDAITEATNPYSFQQAERRRNLGTNYKSFTPIERDSYNSSPQSRVIISNTTGKQNTMGSAGPSTQSGPKSSGKSGVIITTSINKGPGY